MKHVAKIIGKKIFIVFSLLLLCSASLAGANYYWEEPVNITKTDSRFPRTLNSRDFSYVFWEEVDLQSKKIYLTCRKFNSLNQVTELKRFAGPFPYSGNEVPDLYTATIRDDGAIAIAVLSDLETISIFSSVDNCKSFTESKIKTEGIMIAPRIYTTKNNKYKLFTSVGQEDAFTVYTSESKDGISWSRFSQFDPVVEFRNPFIPVLEKTKNGDMVVFQAQYTAPGSNRFSYQIFMTYREGNNWTEPILLTDEKSLNARDSNPYYKYQNQRPYLYFFQNEMYMTWERMNTVNSEIWVAKIDENGVIESSAEKLSSQGNASRCILFSFDGKLYSTWFDTRTGKESVYMSEKTGSYWEEAVLVENRNANLFSNPLIVNEIKEQSELKSIEDENQNKNRKRKGKKGNKSSLEINNISNIDKNQVLTFVWQQKTNNNKNYISMLYPDTTVASPVLKPLTFREGKRSRDEDVQVQIIFPKDSSDIAGYSYTWEKDTPVSPEKELQYFPNRNKITTKAPGDGEYILSVRVTDYAGNWSKPAEITYHRDLTPPLPPVINIDNRDKNGFIESNNFNLKWLPSESDDTAGYTYRIDYLGSIPKVLATTSRHPFTLSDDKAEEAVNILTEKYAENANKKRNMGKQIKTSSLNTPRYYNKDNGVYVLSVSAIDEVGNVSEPATELFILNKFEPSTYITSVEQKRVDTGDTILNIYGGGFTYDGTISKIFIDKDGYAPYDLILEKKNGDFKVRSDTRLTDVNLGSDIDEGSYKIGLLHTDRGLYFTGNVLKIAQNGTVKIESEYVMPPNITSDFQHFKYTIANNMLVLVLLLIFIVLIIIFIVITIKHTTYENSINSQEVKALVTGGKMPTLKGKETKGKHLPSLKGKLIRFTFALIVIVVTVVTVQNGYKSVQIQAKTMASGLLNRTEVLLESLNSGVKNFFPANNLLELTALPNQKEAMDEVKYVTIIGQKRDSESSDNLNYVWATNDEAIELKMGDYELVYGESQITDEIITSITSKFSDLDKVVNENEKDLSNKIEDLTNRATVLYSTGFKEDDAEANRISEVIADLRNKLDEDLSNYSKNAIGSYPQFDVDNLDFENTDYIFYRPVMYRKGNSGNYIHSVVYLELSTKTLIDSVNAEKQRILILGLTIGIVAVLLGIFGSYIFASLIVRPIKKLEAHVTMIGQTKNKVNLKGKDVEIKSKDEVGRLGDAINSMTRELVVNAEEEELAMDGKAVQKAFLPLADTGLNTKNTIAEYEDENIQVYGYYEGEAGVSGDYFDYKKLDNEWYCTIKCDASGHGIPAAIIMTVVATIFRRYFQNWNYKKNGTRLNVLVEQINDFIEGLGLKGKFATLIICLLNIKTGELYMCNAGDNLVHIFDGATKKMKVLTLASAPTAGVFSSDLVAMRGGFVVEKTVLNKGDTLFLYTDGIEESTRRIRELDYSVRQNEVELKRFNPETKQEDVSIQFEDAKEEFGPDRVEKIIESVYNKQKYILTKLDNPNINEKLVFDFEKCEGTVKDTILALASLEKVYRLYKSDSVQQTDYIKIDKKIDEFLSKYFNMYGYYAANKSEVGQNSNYVDYDQMLEDEQSDDLTLLAIKRI